MRLTALFFALFAIGYGVFLGLNHGPFGFLIGYGLVAAIGHLFRVHHRDTHIAALFIVAALLWMIPPARRGIRALADRLANRA